MDGEKVSCHFLRVSFSFVKTTTGLILQINMLLQLLVFMYWILQIQK